VTGFHLRAYVGVIGHVYGEELKKKISLQF
ncbi:MAG: hypothetical protein RIR92_254, partial [Pseudomonadota bacterium]